MARKVLRTAAEIQQNYNELCLKIGQAVTQQVRMNQVRQELETEAGNIMKEWEAVQRTSLSNKPQESKVEEKTDETVQEQK